MTNALIRIDTQIAAFEASLARGRMHHAWLLTGPQGLGKAAFAWRAAARLLGAPSFDFGPNDPAERLMRAGSHPDFLHLELEERDKGGGMRREITVDQARRLPEFFSKAPAISPYRVAIIDAADDFNTNAANAVLKTLEEPSGQGVIFLVSHAPGRLLPTIRSRCRRLVFAPWPQDAIAEFLMTQGVDSGLAALAEGSPGRALRMGEAGASDLDRQVAALLNARGPARLEAVQALADGFRGEAGKARFALVMERLAGAARIRALEGGQTGEGWAHAWQRLAGLTAMVDGLNLDRADALAAALREVDVAVKRAA
jgi:DNA polymerase-3 subunit delta'